jgi:hypothetical protein
MVDYVHLTTAHAPLPFAVLACGLPSVFSKCSSLDGPFCGVLNGRNPSADARLLQHFERNMNTRNSVIGAVNSKGFDKAPAVEAILGEKAIMASFQQAIRQALAAAKASKAAKGKAGAGAPGKASAVKSQSDAEGTAEAESQDGMATRVHAQTFTKHNAATGKAEPAIIMDLQLDDTVDVEEFQAVLESIMRQNGLADLFAVVPEDAQGLPARRGVKQESANDDSMQQFGHEAGVLQRGRPAPGKTPPTGRNGNILDAKRTASPPLHEDATPDDMKQRIQNALKAQRASAAKPSTNDGDNGDAAPEEPKFRRKVMARSRRPA